MRDLRVVTGLGKSRRAHILLCVDCKSHNSSSMVFNIAPKLPQHPRFKGKFIKPFNSLFRSPFRPDHVNASKVSASVHSCSTDVCRLDLDAAALTVGSVDSVSTVWRVSEWLHGLGMSVVSLFVFSRRFVTHMLDLHLYRSDLDSTMSTAGPMDPTGTF